MRAPPLAILVSLLAGAAIAAADEPSLRVRADVLFAARDDAKKLEEAIDLYEGAGAHVMVARGCLLRIELHDDLDRDGDARERWIDRGMRAGERALGTPDPASGLEAIAKKDAEALYWYAALHGRKIEVSSIFRQAGMARRFRRMAERAAALDATVDHGGPHRMLGSFRARAPGLMGGDMEEAARRLDAAVALAPDRFEARVLRAELVHARRGDRKAFRADLERVLATAPEVLPDRLPEQRRAQADARRLLAREGELFD